MKVGTEECAEGLPKKSWVYKDVCWAVLGNLSVEGVWITNPRRPETNITNAGGLWVILKVG